MSDPSNSVPEDAGSPEDFRPHDDYSTLMLAARRKAAPHIGAPAIHRHLAFWLPDKPTLEREEWIKNIEDCFVKLYLRLIVLSMVSEVSTPNKQQRKSQKNTKDDAEPRLYLIHHSYPIDTGDREFEPIEAAKDQPTRHQRLRLSFVWQSMPVSLTLELFDEYFTLSSTIDLSRCPVASSTKLGKGIEIFNCLASKRYAGIGGSDDAAASAPQGSEFTAAFDVIYNTVWKSLYEDIFATPFADHVETLGKVFVESRGFLACRNGSKFIATDGKVEQRLEKQIGNKCFEGNDAIRCVDTIRPFMEADEWLGRDQNDKGSTDIPEPREFTFTPVLNERYIFASALGTPPFHLRDRHTPLTYMLLAANHCPSELGLLVDGFHVLGTTRLAALYDLPHLIHAALELRELEGDINKLLHGMTGGKPATDEELATALPAYSQRLAKIEQGIDTKKHGNQPQIVGGLPFRVERSHYYQRLFRAVVIMLRSGRIQGFLTYDEAVARRLGGIYALIDTVGLRDERLRGILTGLSRRLQTARATELQQSIRDGTGKILQLQEKMTDLTHNIDQVQKEVAAEQRILENILRNSQSTQTEVMRIQLFGEALLTIFLVPYYIVSLLSHGLSCQLHEWCAKEIMWSGQIMWSGVININTELMITAFVFIECAIIGSYRVLTNLRKIRTAAKSEKIERELRELSRVLEEFSRKVHL
jgi:hypothetical protein